MSMQVLCNANFYNTERFHDQLPGMSSLTSSLPPAYVVCRKVMFSVLSVHGGGHYVDTANGPPPVHGPVQTLKKKFTWEPSPTSIGKWAVGLRLQGFLVKLKHNTKSSLSLQFNFSSRIILCRRNFTSIKSFVTKRQ